MFIRVTPMCVIAPLRCAAGAAMNHRKVATTPRENIARIAGLAVVVRAGDHQGARHQSDGGRRLLMLLHGDAEQLPLGDQDDERRNDGERALADHQAPERDAGQDDPVRNAAGTSRSPSPGPRRSRSAPTSTEAAPASWDRRGPRPHHHRPRGSVVLIEVGAGCRPRRRRRGCRRTGRLPSWWRAPAASTATTSSIGSSSGPSSTWIDPEKCSAAASMSSADGSSSSPDPSSTAWGTSKSPPWSRRTPRGRTRPRRMRLRAPTTASRSVSMSSSSIASPMSSSIGSSTLVSYQASSSSSSSSIVDEAGETGRHPARRRSRPDRVPTVRTATCSSCGLRRMRPALVGFPIDVADGREELVQVLEQIVAAGLVVCH